jgi:hypothetical protein
LPGVSPDDEDKPFVARWNTLVSALLIEPSIKLVARTACDYGFMDGENVYPGNERLARQTGYDERTVREAWHFLRAAGMAHRVELSAWTGSRRNADRYELAIPSGWRSMPMLGPHAGKFACQQCGRRFTPGPCNTWQTRKTPKGEAPLTNKDGMRELGWYLWKVVFCPAPQRGPDKAKGCFSDWKLAHGKWGDDRAWKAFSTARGDDWPQFAARPAA